MRYHSRLCPIKVVQAAMRNSYAQKSALRLIYRDLRKYWWHWRDIVKWRLDGKPVPAPSSVKRSLLLRQLRRSNLRTFVETGTLYGDTVAYLRPWCDAIH